MNLADKIRDLSTYAEPESISEALSIPLNIVTGVLDVGANPKKNVDIGYSPISPA